MIYRFDPVGTPSVAFLGGRCVAWLQPPGTPRRAFPTGDDSSQFGKLLFYNG